jgi:hypothetical protein
MAIRLPKVTDAVFRSVHDADDRATVATLTAKVAQLGGRLPDELLFSIPQAAGYIRQAYLDGAQRDELQYTIPDDNTGPRQLHLYWPQIEAEMRLMHFFRSVLARGEPALTQPYAEALFGDEMVGEYLRRFQACALQDPVYGHEIANVDRDFNQYFAPF